MESGRQIAYQGSSVLEIIAEAGYDALKDYVLRNCIRWVTTRDIEWNLRSLAGRGLVLCAWQIMPQVRFFGSMFHIQVSAEFMLDSWKGSQADLEAVFARMNGKLTRVSWQQDPIRLDAYRFALSQRRATLEFEVMNFGYERP